MESVYRDTRGGVERPEGSRPGEIEFYPQTAGADELIDAFAIAGPAVYCAERLGEIAALGFGRIYIGTRAVGVDLEEGNAERIGREVLAPAAMSAVTGREVQLVRYPHGEVRANDFAIVERPVASPAPDRCSSATRGRLSTRACVCGSAREGPRGTSSPSRSRRRWTGS